MSIAHKIDSVKLPNGSEGLLIDAPSSPVVAYSIQFRGGKTKELRGFPYQIGHTLEHIIECGPDRAEFSKKADYLREIQKNGAWRNAYTGESGISYVGDCTTDELLRILQLRINSIENPKLSENNLKSESGNVLEEIRQRAVDYTRLTTALSRKKINDDAWLTSLEAMKDAESVTLTQVKNFYKRTHTSSNLRFVIIGDISRIKDSIVDVFSSVDLPLGKRLDGSDLVPVSFKGYCYELRPGLENLFTSYAMAISRKLNSKEAAIMQIVNNLLCNSWDSEILGKARSAGLCYGMHGYVEVLKTQSIWVLDTPIGFKNAADFFGLMSRALKKYATGTFEEDAIERAKAFLIGSTKKNGQTSLELINLYGEEYFTLDEVTDLQDRIALLKNVSYQDISTLVHEFVNAGSQVFSGVGSVKEDEFRRLYENFVVNL